MTQQVACRFKRRAILEAQSPKTNKSTQSNHTSIAIPSDHQASVKPARVTHNPSHHSPPTCVARYASILALMSAGLSPLTSHVCFNPAAHAASSASTTALPSLSAGGVTVALGLAGASFEGRDITTGNWAFSRGKPGANLRKAAWHKCRIGKNT